MENPAKPAGQAEGNPGQNGKRAWAQFEGATDPNREEYPRARLREDGLSRLHTESVPKTGLGDIDVDLPEADFWGGMKYTLNVRAVEKGMCLVSIGRNQAIPLTGRDLTLLFFAEARSLPDVT